MTVTTKRSLISLLLALVLIVSLFTVGFSAEEGNADDAYTPGDIAGEANATTEADSAEVTTEADDAEVTTESGSTADGTEEDSEKSTEKETEEDTSAAAAEEAINATKKVLIINGIIIAVIVIIAVILAVKFREKLGNFLRSVKSEMKKIVWSSKENTRKSFLVVMVVAIAVAILIGIVDIAFNLGISGLADIFRH